jgi:hypothetical protein
MGFYFLRHIFNVMRENNFWLTNELLHERKLTDCAIAMPRTRKVRWRKGGTIKELAS